MPVKNRIQIRRGTTEQWNETTDILSDGEIGFDSSQYNIKIGDGSSTWTELDWLVDLSGQIVSNTGIFDVIEFNTDPPVVPVEGQLVWSNTYGTLSLGLEGDHIFHIGQETNFRVRNQTGDNLYKGQPVAATGVHSDNIRLRVNKYAADASLREVRFIGLISEDIANNESGFSTNFGYVRGNTTSILDTRGNVESAIAVGDETWVQGDILYVHPTVAGKLTKVEPKHSISVAIVIRVHQEQGVLLVRPTSYGHLNDNHDVSVSGATNGQFLQYNSATDYWIPSSSGNFSTLLVNGTGVSVSGHTHTSSNITNFNSSVSGLLPVGTANYLSKFGTGGSGLINSLVFDNGTNVGIGTGVQATTPPEKLTVDGHIRLADTAVTQGNVVQFNRGGGTQYDYTIGKYGSPSALAVSLANDPNSQRPFQVGYHSGVTFLPKFHVNGYTGDVGIGTTTPSTLLEISKDGGGVDLSLVRIANTNATGGASLNISRTGPQRAAQVIYQSGTTNQFYQGILRDGGSTTNGWSVSAGADLNVTAPAIHVTSGNYVGIGTKSPQVLLHVNGQAYLQSLNLTGGTADRILATDTNKNVVGLNTSTYPTLTELSYVKGATSSIQTQLNTKAPLSSPAFTGTPTAPTASSGTNTTQIATTAFVRTEISSLVDAAPGTLDTLNELAAALGDDPNFATTVTNSIAAKQATITGGASTITSSNLTINRALISDSNGKVAVSDITNTELNYLDNASSNIQTQINTKIAYGEYSQSNPVFGQKGIKHNIVDNVLYSAADRFEFYIDNVLQSSNSLFNLNYDQVAVAFLPNVTKIFRLVFNTKNNSAMGITYPQGSVYFSFYYTAIPASVSGRVKDKDGVWSNITNWTNVAINNPPYAVWRGTVPNNVYLVEMELTVVGGSVAIIGADATWLSQIEYVMDRPGEFELGVLNKAQDATLWRNINFKNNSNTTTLSLTSAGNINLTSSTASRILSTDGSKNIVALDTATYPSLTELSYVKGATSNIQTQLNSKTGGTGTTGKIPKWSSTSTLTDSIMSESSTVVNIAGSLNGQSDDSYLSFDANARRIGITKKGGFTGKFTYGSGSSFAIAQSNSGTIEATNTFTDRLVIDPSGNVGIGTATPTYKLQVNGSFAASTKSFRIDHPSKKDHSLEYGSLESPYHGVRLTGRGTVIKGVGTVSLPDYLKDLIHDDDTLNIQITNIKHGKTIYLEEIDLKNDQFIVKADRAKSLGELEFFWTLTGVRKDVDHLVVEKEN